MSNKINTQFYINSPYKPQICLFQQNHFTFRKFTNLVKLLLGVTRIFSLSAFNMLIAFQFKHHDLLVAVLLVRFLVTVSIPLLDKFLQEATQSGSLRRQIWREKKKNLHIGYNENIFSINYVPENYFCKLACHYVCVYVHICFQFRNRRSECKVYAQTCVNSERGK